MTTYVHAYKHLIVDTPRKITKIDDLNTARCHLDAICLSSNCGKNKHMVIMCSTYLFVLDSKYT
jgi:hypothetical protein